MILTVDIRLREKTGGERGSQPYSRSGRIARIEAAARLVGDGDDGGRSCRGRSRGGQRRCRRGALRPDRADRGGGRHGPASGTANSAGAAPAEERPRAEAEAVGGGVPRRRRAEAAAAETEELGRRRQPAAADPGPAGLARAAAGFGGGGRGGATWQRAIRPGTAADASGPIRTCPAARRGVRLGFRPEFRGRDLFIGVEGARSVQMRCSFHPHDRDRTTESMEGS